MVFNILNTTEMLLQVFSDSMQQLLGSCEFIATIMNIQVYMRNWSKFLNIRKFLGVESRDETP